MAQAEACVNYPEAVGFVALDLRQVGPQAREAPAHGGQEQGAEYGCEGAVALNPVAEEDRGCRIGNSAKQSGSRSVLRQNPSSTRQFAQWTPTIRVGRLKLTKRIRAKLQPIVGLLTETEEGDADGECVGILARCTPDGVHAFVCIHNKTVDYRHGQAGEWIPTFTRHSCNRLRSLCAHGNFNPGVSASYSLKTDHEYNDPIAI